VHALHLASSPANLAGAGGRDRRLLARTGARCRCREGPERYAAAKGVSFGYRFFDAKHRAQRGLPTNWPSAPPRTRCCFVNPDTYCAPTAIRYLVDAFDDPSAAAADARQIPAEHPRTSSP